MAAVREKGNIYRCPVCGAEVTVVAGRTAGAFHPICCNRAMVVKRQRAVFYVCPVCGAEIVVVKPGAGVFAPHCCHRDMIRRRAA